MYCSMVSAIASASSSSEYSCSFVDRTPCHALPETKDKQSVGFALKKDGKFLHEKSNRKTKILVTVPGNQYAVSNGSGYAVLISLDEYAVLDKKLDMPYPMEVDTPYSIDDQNSLEVGLIRRIQVAFWGFLGVGTTFDIFQNIILIPYLEYGVLSPLDMAY
ncbi:hypothetical protein Tco_1079265 [Tanacetum coccineum]|uniref:Uncharacterized protein n=1 Tax=Tanacetum coccineum TaxID=301880 RepID=A0ABQ5HSX3_9ASTR